MPVSESEQPQCTIACDIEHGWTRCPSCGRVLFWVESLVGSLIVKCQGCKTTVRFVFGIVVEGEVGT